MPNPGLPGFPTQGMYAKQTPMLPQKAAYVPGNGLDAQSSMQAGGDWAFCCHSHDS